jgi:hypothetical protein
MSLVSAAVLVTFALAGSRRHDGVSYNERYLLELLPLAAVGFAWAFEERRLLPFRVLIGAAVGLFLALLVMVATPMTGGPEVTSWLVRQVALMKAPMVLAALLTVLWFFNGRQSTALNVAAGVCLGWGLMVHLGSDVAMSLLSRQVNLARTRGHSRRCDGAAHSTTRLSRCTASSTPRVPTSWRRSEAA